MGQIRHSEPSEEYDQLMSRVARRDEAAFARFYDATAGRVYALALRITGDAPTAEEAVSDVYFQVWRQAERYDAARGSVLAWLLTICRSRALDARRRRDPAETHAEPGDLLAAETGANEPLDLLLAVERNSWVYRQLEALSETERRLLALAFFRGLTHAEIAADTGLPLGTVKSLLRRGLQRLRQNVDGVAADLEEHR